MEKESGRPGMAVRSEASMLRRIGSAFSPRWGGTRQLCQIAAASEHEERQLVGQIPEQVCPLQEQQGEAGIRDGILNLHGRGRFAKGPAAIAFLLAQNDFGAPFMPVG